MGIGMDVSFEMVIDIGEYRTLPDICPGYRSGEGQVIMPGELR